MITGIAKVNIDVSDMSGALTFFAEKLGLSVLREIGSREYANRWEFGVTADGPRVATVQPKHERPLLPGRVSIIFRSDNIEADYRQMAEKGVNFIQPPTAEPFEGQIAYFEGPDDTLLGLVQPSEEQ
jgi:predicted enzyme related to lactoylglutathione lyase